MLIPVYHGTGMYGRIVRADGSEVATRFYHFYFLPLIPLGSYRDGTFVGIHPLSLFLGWFKVWGAIGAFALLVSGLSRVARYDGMGALVSTTAALLLMGAVAATWLFVGRRALDRRPWLWSILLTAVAALGPVYVLSTGPLPSFTLLPRARELPATPRPVDEPPPPARALVPYDHSIPLAEAIAQ